MKSASVKPILSYGKVRISRIVNVCEHKIRLHIVLEMLFDARKDVKNDAVSKMFIALFLQNGKVSGVDVLWPSDTCIAAHPCESKGIDTDRRAIYDEDWTYKETS